LKYNYQLETDKITNSLGTSRPRLLLQCCCGPCSSYVLEYLCRYFQVTALFYNPNIYPAGEYEKRLYWFDRLLEEYGVEKEECPYEPAEFDTAAASLASEPEGGARCTECFRLRLGETARRAADGGYDYFCTTLTVSPHKDAQRINVLGKELEKMYNVRWLPSDFKKREGYKRSIELSAQYGLYRQNYCGCRYSLQNTHTTGENKDE